MKQQLASCLISLAFCSGNLFAMTDRGNIVQSELKDLVVSKITVVADRKKVIATLTQGCSGVHVIPAGPAPVVRGGGDGPKPLDARTFQFELDPIDEVDALTFHLLLKAQGSFSTINIALGANGQISSVELGGSCPSVVYEQGGHIAKQ